MRVREDIDRLGASRVASSLGLIERSAHALRDWHVSEPGLGLGGTPGAVAGELTGNMDDIVVTIYVGPAEGPGFSRTQRASGDGVEEGPRRVVLVPHPIKERLDVDSVLEPTDRAGQFDVVADGQLVASRGGNVLTRVLLGAGFPDSEDLVDELARRLG